MAKIGRFGYLECSDHPANHADARRPDVGPKRNDVQILREFKIDARVRAAFTRPGHRRTAHGDNDRVQLWLLNHDRTAASFGALVIHGKRLRMA